MTPRKKKASKLKEKLDDSFLRCSKRISQKLQGFKDAESAKKAKESAQTVEDEPVPLAMILACKDVAPHLPREVLQGLGQGFL